MMSHVTWDLEVNLLIVPASQCASRAQIPGRCAPRHLLGCCHHCEPRPQRPGAKSLLPQGSRQCCCGAQRVASTASALLLAAPVNVPKGWAHSCWACPQQLQGKGSDVPKPWSRGGSKASFLPFITPGVNVGYHLGACHRIVWILLTYSP